MFRIALASLVCAIALGTAARTASADVIPSPANDLALQSNGGVAYGDGTSWDTTHMADKLNDGNRDGNFGDNPVGLYHSGDHVGGSFGVVLAGADTINQVNLFTRTDCCSDRIDGGGTSPFTLQILLGGVPQFTQNYTFSSDFSISGTDGSALGTVISVPNVVGDEVRITQNFQDYINIAELEAYAATPEPASLGVLSIGAAGLVFRRRRA